ncbi:MAG TPA: TetR family transcriptional regulator [Actinomycetota bacterium]|nr:TetR family transcriptional regulator [Actinomycetota bacterium]
MGTRDAAATKERILEAAFEEFATRGFAGSRVDDIADKAQCNKALLYQYYGDKEALFRHVLECKMAGLQSIKEDPDSFAEAVGEFFDFYAANPWLPRMLMWEALDFGDERVPNEAERAQKFEQHVERLEQAQQAGTVDPELDPRQTLVSLIGLIHIWFAAPQTARMICGGNPYTKEALKRRRAHVVDAARRMLETR